MDEDIKFKLQEIDRLKENLDTLKPFDAELLSCLKTHIDTELTYNTNAIEGNTLSYNDTKFILTEGHVGKGRNIREILEVVNHRDAMRYIETLTVKPPYIVTAEEILRIHREILKGIDNEYAGKYRNDAVFIRVPGKKKIQQFPDWQEVPGLVTALLQWLRENEKNCHPVLLAAELHYRFVSIHPFKDGNGRTARLLMSLMLLQNGYTMANISMENRDEYLDAIDYARETGDMTNFYKVVIAGLQEILDLYIQTFTKRIIWR